MADTTLPEDCERKMKKLFYYILAIGFFALMIFTNLPYQWLTQRTLDAALIKDKQISTESNKNTGEVKSTYLIYTDHGVFRNDDAFWFMKFNSSDFYGNLDVGKFYQLKVYGWRIPILTMYPNIVRMKLVPAPSAATSGMPADTEIPATPAPEPVKTD
jgi:hypothetical protein